MLDVMQIKAVKNTLPYPCSAQVWKIKAIYHSLNQFNIDTIQNGLIAECWIPVADLETVQLALRRGTVSTHLTTVNILKENLFDFIKNVYIHKLIIRSFMENGKTKYGAKYWEWKTKYFVPCI